MTIIDERPSENDHSVPVTGFPIGAELPPNLIFQDRAGAENLGGREERAIAFPLCKVGGQSPSTFYYI